MGDILMGASIIMAGDQACIEALADGFLAYLVGRLLLELANKHLMLLLL